MHVETVYIIDRPARICLGHFQHRRQIEHWAATLTPHRGRRLEQLYLGLDLGGTDIKVGVVDDQANVLASDTAPTEAAQGPDHVIGRIAELAASVCDEAETDVASVCAAGIGVPGPIDRDKGIVLSAPNLNGWTQVPLKQNLLERFGTDLSLEVVNDANAAAYGEFWAGAGRDNSITHMIMLTLGTGVGGGVILNGELYAGAHGEGAELGHIILDPLGPRCASGERGSLEVYASASAIVGEAERRIAMGSPTQLPPQPTAKDVFDLSATDPLAGEIVDWACGYLGIACANLVRIFDPQMIVLGGGVALAGDKLLKPVRQAFTQRTWTIRPEQVTIELATLGNDAGFIGSAGMARHQVCDVAEETTKR
jgi:glucokinase